ncbi:MAG: HlyC/CorC family transporter [Nitrospirae bacterium]|nr:HlyC/CorC family transporter [Nitrospirota bacterium]
MESLWLEAILIFVLVLLSFLATVQVGITFVGLLAGAVGGAAAVEVLEPVFARIPGMERFGEPLSIVIVVTVISYFTLIFGELVPKSLALRFSEPIALSVGGLIQGLSRGSSIPVRLLTWSTRTILRPFLGQLPREGSLVTEEEIKIMLREGGEKGVFDQSEQDLIHSVFEFADTTVKEVMVPRPKINAIAMDTPPDVILKYIVESGFSRFPVYEGTLDETRGILHQKDIMEAVLSQRAPEIRKLLHPVYFVPETKKISDLLKELQRRRVHMAIVVNEYGSVEGLVTIEDLIEEIVGEIEDEYDLQERPVERLRDGSMVVDASMSIRDLADRYELSLPESEDYETLAGFMLSHIQKMPRGGEIIRLGPYKLTVVDMEGKRIARVKVEKVP